MRFRWGFVLPLAFAQLVSWGSLYYAFAVIAGPMGAEMGWSKPAVTGALSAGLAATGFASLIAGRVIDIHGGRVLMTTGSIGAALLLLTWSQVRELWQLYAIWIAMGAVFSTVLYEPVFAVMARELKNDYRRGIIVITLLGGLASTVFIPLTHWLADSLGWRQALIVLAGLQAPFGILIHWLTLKRGDGEVVAVKTPKLRGRVGGAMKKPVFWLLALSYGAHAFMFTGLTFHIIPLLSERGFSMPVIVAAYSVVGPFQVIGRIIVFSFENRIDARITGFFWDFASRDWHGTPDVVGSRLVIGISVCRFLRRRHGHQDDCSSYSRARISGQRRLWSIARNFRGHQFRGSSSDAICSRCSLDAARKLRRGIVDTVRISLCFRSRISGRDCHQAERSASVICKV